MGVDSQHHAAAALLPAIALVAIGQEAGWFPGWETPLHAPGMKPQTIQPIVSCCADYAILALASYVVYIL
jgi:hypothetical protein